MKFTPRKNHPINVVLAALVWLGLALGGCSSTPPQRAHSPGKEQGQTATSEVGAGKGGAQLWAESCGQCHNLRDPGSFSEAQWEVIMLHMRVRANLTGQEHRAIAEFLKSAN